MKIRDSGMPDEGSWTTFFDPVAILQKVGLSPDASVVVDMGCGYGTFSIPAAQLTHGVVYAVDIEPEMLATCQRKAEELGLENLITVQRDFFANSTGLADHSADFCMLFNILHTAQPVQLLLEAYRILRPGAKVSIIHWNYDPNTPRGPAMVIRPRPEQCVSWLKEAGFVVQNPIIDLPPYHYGIVATKL